eukprot:5524818-Prymnesium_polylepis.1
MELLLCWNELGSPGSFGLESEFRLCLPNSDACPGRGPELRLLLDLRSVPKHPAQALRESTHPPTAVWHDVVVPQVSKWTELACSLKEMRSRTGERHAHMRSPGAARAATSSRDLPMCRAG